MQLGLVLGWLEDCTHDVVSEEAMQKQSVPKINECQSPQCSQHYTYMPLVVVMRLGTWEEVLHSISRIRESIPKAVYMAC